MEGAAQMVDTRLARLGHARKRLAALGGSEAAHDPAFIAAGVGIREELLRVVHGQAVTARVEKAEMKGWIRQADRALDSLPPAQLMDAYARAQTDPDGPADHEAPDAPPA
jgi:hypothetical protein